MSHATYSPTPGPPGRVPKNQMVKIMGNATSLGRDSLAALLEIKGWDSPYRERYANARSELERRLKVKYTAVKPFDGEFPRELPQ